jgi:hypothetical protein
MFYALLGYLHAEALRRVRAIRALAETERGQGTVEYVGLILLVSLLMVGMVAAMKGFNGKQGTELADVIVNKIKQAVNVGRENAGKERLVVGIASGFAEPKTVYWSSRSSPQLLAASDEDVRSLFGA